MFTLEQLILIALLSIAAMYMIQLYRTYRYYKTYLDPDRTLIDSLYVGFRPSVKSGLYGHTIHPIRSYLRFLTGDVLNTLKGFKAFSDSITSEQYDALDRDLIRLKTVSVNFADPYIIEPMVAKINTLGDYYAGVCTYTDLIKDYLESRQTHSHTAMAFKRFCDANELDYQQTYMDVLSLTTNVDESRIARLLNESKKVKANQ